MNTRLHYIDALRVLAFLCLIVFHCAVPFVEDYHWEINSDKTSPLITTLIWWMHQWRLPLLFFISGVGVRFSLKRRSVLAFAGERVLRLFVPLAFAMLFITPVQVYFEWLQQGKISESYWIFYPRVLDFVPYPDGSLTWSHMWFVAYLFVFTILLIPVFALVKIPGTRRWVTWIDPVFRSPFSLLSLAVPFIACIGFLYIDWPEQGSLLDDWYVFISSMTYFFFGFMLSAFPSFWQSCLQFRKVFLVLAMGPAIALVAFYFSDWSVNRPREDGPGLYRFAVLNGLHVWSILLACIGYAMRYLNREQRLIRYLNTAVYPFFILHQAIIVAAGYYILQWDLEIWTTLGILVLICLSGIWVLYEGLIRRTALTRILFGMKWKPTPLGP